MILPPFRVILTYVSSRLSEIVNKDFIWNYQKSQKRVFFVKVFSGFLPFPESHTRKSKISSPCHVLQVDLWKFLKINRIKNIFMHQSIPSANIPLGNFFEVVKSPAPGQNFLAKAWPPGQKDILLF